MFARKFIQNPMLAIGILMVVLVYFDWQGRGIGLFNREVYRTYACHGAIVMLEKRIPSYWKTSCRQNNLESEVDLEMASDDIKNALSSLEHLDADAKVKLQKMVYRELANALKFISQNTQSESLERVDIVSTKILAGPLTVSSISTGPDVLTLKEINRPDNLKIILGSKVKVQEKWQK